MNKKRWLYLLCLVEVGTMLVFHNYSAVLPIIQEEWGLSNAQSGIIYSAYQVGYIILVVLLSTLTDYIDTKKIYVISALWAGIAGVLFSLCARGFVSALIFRCFTGFGLAGTYMPGLKMVSAKFEQEKRGSAVGTYVGAFSFGTALSMYMAGLLTSLFHWRTAMFITSLGPVLAGIFAWTIVDSMPPVSAHRRKEKTAGQILSNRPALLVIAAYAGHMWEMFGMRGWIVAFLVAAMGKSRMDTASATSVAAMLSSLIILAGAFSTFIAGKLSDCYGRAQTISIIMLLSACCSLVFGWSRPLPFVIVVLLSLFYGFLVTAESSVFSTTLTELVPFHCLGTAMALQSFIGWTAASISPVVFGAVLDITNSRELVKSLGFVPHWGPAFMILSLGALSGLLAMFIFKKIKHQQHNFYHINGS